MKKKSTLLAIALITSAPYIMPMNSSLAPYGENSPDDRDYYAFVHAQNRKNAASSQPSSGTVTPTAGTPKPVATQAPTEPSLLNLGAGAAGEKKQS